MPASPRPSRATPPATSAPRSRRMPRPSAPRVVRDFVGHGVGQLFHDEPNITHFGVPGTGIELKPGHDLHHRADDQSRPAARQNPVRRLDRRHPRPHALSAQAEHSIGITETGHEIFTASPRGLFNPLASRRAGRVSKPAKPSVDGPGRGAAQLDLKAGHRDRVRERFNKVGGEAFTDAELLEAVLHLAIPRRDTKDLAKLLLEALRLVLGRAVGAARAAGRVRRSGRHQRHQPQDHPGRGAALRARPGRPRAADPRAHGRR